MGHKHGGTKERKHSPEDRKELRKQRVERVTQPTLMTSSLFLPYYFIFGFYTMSRNSMLL
jgi:hypothetical protein